MAACPAFTPGLTGLGRSSRVDIASSASDSSDSASSDSPSGGAQMNFASCSTGSLPSGQVKPVSMTTEASNRQ